MQDLDMKKKVAQEIMALMDEKDGERLKSHPKLMAKSPAPEMPMEGEEMLAEGVPVEGEEEISPEMLQKLMEMLGE